MCFSATANFVGSGVLGAVGVVTLTKVKHRVATCGSLSFSRIRAMVIFGAANLAILLVVMEVQRSAFTSLGWHVRGHRQSHHRRLLLEKRRGPAVPLCASRRLIPREPAYSAVCRTPCGTRSSKLSGGLT